ncbi:DUF4129 domain-containing protein [Microbacterium protaetiae]|uniref:DUF4129 domain-containing protein n=1 Tax=Microbacterium protaetiae TaxID=2509458 RepID=A0A4P6EEN9_9MICO|nr:DUF4129 domain-containing protein [Microbacterium protaetiae]QAY60654.1 DUF4129 domain-containing protein [Microbacterium protaetiae]
MIRLPFADDVPPLTPDGDQARQWAEHELSDPAYAAAHPTPIDRIARSVQEFFDRLFNSGVNDAVGLWLGVGVAVVLLALIVVAVIFSGRSRLSRRATPEALDLFGDAETRTAAQLRRAAASAAGAGDYDEAIVLRFRALARGLVERRVIELVPGATVHAFARRAGEVFRSEQAVLDAAAGVFDDVRYLRRAGTADGYGRVARADDAVRDRQLASEPAR